MKPLCVNLVTLARGPDGRGDTMTNPAYLPGFANHHATEAELDRPFRR